MEEDPLAATALPSLATSAGLFLAMWKLSPLGDLPLTQLFVFAMLPTLSALACLQDKRFLPTFKRLFLWYVLRTDDFDDSDGTVSDELRAARIELLKNVGERWPLAAGGVGSGSFSLSRFSNSTQLDASAASGVGAGTNKSLYDQVRSHLTDHAFPKNHDAPIYFMDPTSGRFLRVNEQHKLVFTDTPDASSLFHVVKGKTHHWGFHSAIHQRYIGMNVLNKVVVNSKKMQGWESFRVLERPERAGADDANAGQNGGTGRTIYFVLCSARFGKGMWLGRHRRTPSNPTDTYLTKNFANALALVYASDLSAFEYLSRPRDSVIESQELTGSASDQQVSSSSLTASTVEDDPFGSDFRAPVLQTSERSKVVLPWIDEGTSRRFLELPEREMVEVVSTTISRCTVRELLEFFIDQDARRMCHQKTSQPPPAHPNSSSRTESTATSEEQRVNDWHLHPQFGFVRKLSYRPPAPSEAQDTEQGSSIASMAASVAIDQYDSCSVDEKSLQKAVFRSKIFTLSIPKSNTFSVETVFELQDAQERDGIYAITPINPIVVFKCRAGVRFTRKTMFSSQIEKGVLEGVKSTCDVVLRLAHEYRASSPSDSRPSLESSSQIRTRREIFSPHTVAVEVIKGLINVIRGNDRVGTSITRRGRSSLNIQMPWTPAPVQFGSNRFSRTQTLYRPRVGGFFECLPQAFECVHEETFAMGITPSLVFDLVLSDECSFFHVVNKRVGNMEVDIGAWRPARFQVEGPGVTQSFLRKQLFRMPVSGVAGLDVTQVEDYQYYAIQKASDQSPERLEFGMKIYARDLPDGERLSIEALVVVEQSSLSPSTSEASSCTIRVSYAIARGPGETDLADDPLNAALVQGTARGLKRVWGRVVRVIQEAVQRTARPPFSLSSISAEDFRHRLQIEGQIPSHDELTSTIIDSITELY